MSIVLHNGAFISASGPILNFTNRSFLYGDGLFESMLWKDRHLHFPEQHIERLKKGMLLFDMNDAGVLTAAWLKENCPVLIEKNGIDGQARVRLNIYREGGGVYTPDGSQVHYVLSCFPITEEYSAPVKNMGVFEAVRKPKGEISNYKTTSSAVYVLAGLYARKNGFDDVFILNPEGNITDAVSSNVFIIKNQELITPPLSDGCLDGVMRKYVLAHAFKAGFHAREKSLSVRMVEEADELFLTNAVARIKPVLRFAGKPYPNHLTEILRNEILK
jgi:branched-chain amino acid aminotransferase